MGRRLNALTAKPAPPETLYAIQGGVEGRERLRLLSRVFAGATALLLDRAGVAEGTVCLDLGCGGGDVSLELARRTGPRGRVLGLDIDPVPLDLARAEARAADVAHVEYRQHDVTGPLKITGVDLAHCRFLLSHLADPAGTLSRISDALKPGGRIAVMDVDFRGHFAWPESEALDRFVELYTAVVAKRGGNANIGPRLPGLLMQAGFEDVEMELVHRAALTGEVKLLTAVTMQLIAGAAEDAGLADEAELRRLIETLYAEARDPTRVMGLPRVILSWGRKPG